MKQISIYGFIGMAMAVLFAVPLKTKAAAPVFSNINLPPATVGQLYAGSVDYSPCTTGGSTAVQSLPAGVNWSGPAAVAGNATACRISFSGIPITAGSYSVQVTVNVFTSSAYSQNFTLQVNAASSATTTGSGDTYAFLTDAALPVATVGQQYATGIDYTTNVTSAINGSFGSLPPGLRTGVGSDTLNNYSMTPASNGGKGTVYISGVPTTPGIYTINLYLNNPNWSGSGMSGASKQFTITVKAAGSSANSLQIPGVALPSGTVGTFYTATIPFSYNGTYALNATWTGLPPGISGGGAASNPNTIMGILPGLQTSMTVFGTPTQAGTYSATLSMTDQYGATATQNFLIVIATSGSLSITGTALPSATVGQSYYAVVPFSYTGSAALNATWSGLPSGIVGQGLPSNPNTVVGILGNSSTVSLSGTPTQAGVYTVTLQMTDQGTKNASKTFSLVVSNVSQPVFNSAARGSAHTDYTNVLGTDGTVYRIVSGFRYPYTSAGAFLSYGFNSWSNVVPATTGDMQLPLATYVPSGSSNAATSFITPRNGSLINDNGTIYLITNGMRIGFASSQAFLGLGYSFSNAQSGDTSFMVSYAPINSSQMAHPDGTLVNDNGTIYLMKNNARMGFPSMDVFYSWGYKTSDIVPANSFDRAAPVSGVAATRMANQLNM